MEDYNQGHHNYWQTGIWKEINDNPGGEAEIEIYNSLVRGYQKLKINIKDIKKDADTGYFFEVDLEYPKEIHDYHNDYPLAPEPKCIQEEDLSQYAKEYLDEYGLKLGKAKKLMVTLNDKEKYVIHYRTLQLYLSLGLKLKKIHRVISFHQKDWMRGFIEHNTEKRSKAKNDFEKNLFKLMNNSVYGKTMENVRNRMDFQLVTNEKRLRKLSRKPNIKAWHQYNENLVGVHLARTKVELNKPMYTGIAILDLSKWLMYDFHYNVMKKKYGQNIQLLATDTDSLKYEIQTSDLYKDMKEMSEYFDFSDYPKDHFCYSDANIKKIGKFKDETNSKPIVEFVAHKSKMYSQLVYKGDDKYDSKRKAKGVKKNVVEHDISHETYKSVLFDQKVVSATMKTFRSHKHTIYTIEQMKTALTPYDDKMYILKDENGHGINTLAYGHYRIKEGIPHVEMNSEMDIMRKMNLHGIKMTSNKKELKKLNK